MEQEEKLQEAKRLYKTANADQRYVLESLFPELKESEDERIRKEIIAFLTYYHTGQGNSVKYDDKWIAWLEKQSNLVKYYENKLDKCACDCFNKGYKKALEKQGKQQPADKVEPKFKVGDTIRSSDMEEVIVCEVRDNEYLCDEGRNYCIVPFNKQDQWKIVEQKSAEWTAEDEEELKIALNTLEEAGQYSSAKWLKNVCLVPQPKQEWSEEDEKHLNRAINILGISKAYTTSPDRYEDTINWLKSLKGRYTWKPSELQLEALESATENCAYSEYQDCLRELIEQLKKLKE